VSGEDATMTGPREIGMAAGAVRPGCPDARRLAARLVALIERDGLSVAAAARSLGMELALAGLLVRLVAIERECAQTELEERLEEIQQVCPGEDWWSSSDRQLALIFSGEAISNRIVRELVQAGSSEAAGRPRGSRRSWGSRRRRCGAASGSPWIPARREHGRRYRPRRQKTITVEAAGRIVRAIGIPACEVPGL
jgi:hypothetical protein